MTALGWHDVYDMAFQDSIALRKLAYMGGNFHGMLDNIGRS